ncbi:MAG: hypothetical protein U1E42_14950 [Rhodospirillales bacterium]
MNAIDRDPLFRRFFARVPPDIAETFNDEQVNAIKRAFGSRSSGSHAVDLRFSVPFSRRRAFYFVLLAGKERRSSRRRSWERRLRPLATIGNALTMIFFSFLLLVAVLALLYVTKRALHIDFFPGINMMPDAKIERMLY